MPHHARAKEPSRRGFIVQAASSFAAAGGVAALWSLMDQTNPNAATPAREALTIDLRPIAPGQTLAARWRGMPLLVRHRTPVEQALAATTRVADLIDPYARNTALPARTPAVDSKRTQTGHANWLVVVGLCTHMGCPLLPSGATTDASDREITWVCPCHAARFDYSGHVRSGPARTNVEVPAYRFVTPWQIRLE